MRFLLARSSAMPISRTLIPPRSTQPVPIQGYQDLAIATHNLYSNYNSLQVSWIRTKGKYTST